MSYISNEGKKNKDSVHATIRQSVKRTFGTIRSKPSTDSVVINCNFIDFKKSDSSEIYTWLLF